MFNLPPPEDDGLEIAQVGPWSRHKHYFLRKYIDAFTTAMKGKWSGLYYVDLFAGPGVVRIEGTNELEWGSPLIAAQAPREFDRLFFCDLKRANCAALEQRVEALGVAGRCTVIRGNANENVEEVVRQIPSGSLTLCFLDPFGLQLEFSTVKMLSQRRSDLIIFFPDRLDALRNCEYVYKDNPNSNLDKFLGPSVNWRDQFDATPKEEWARLLRKLYETSIKTLGYTKFETERIYAKNNPLYLLVFCSTHPLAAKLWRSVSEKKPDGQRTIDWGD